MMDFKVHYSGSSGNLYSVSNGDTTLMLECGVSWKQIQQAFNFKTASIDACLLGHEHGDHSKAVKDVMKAGIDIFTSRGTTESLGLSGHRLHTIEADKQFSIGTWKIIPFETIHDAAEPLGFLLGSGNERVLFCIDSNYINPRFKKLSTIAIGVNHDTDILQKNILNGTIDVALGKRIMGNHMSIETATGFFRANDMSKVQEIYLLHLSDRNASDGFKEEIERITGKPVYLT